MILLAVGNIIHLITLPYCDLTLLAANSPVSIIANLFFSIWLFDEKFIMKYDLPALAMIITGTLFIVILANKKQNEYRASTLIELVYDPKAIIFFTLIAIITIATYFIIYKFKKLLRNFERDADLYEQKIK